MDNPVLHLLGKLLVALCVHLIALTDTVLFNLLLLLSLCGPAICKRLIRLSYIHTTMPLMWLDFVGNCTLRFFCSSFFEASLHDLAVLLVAHLIQHGEVRLVQELHFGVLLLRRFLSIEGVAGARPSL